MIFGKILDIRVNYTEIFYTVSLNRDCIRKKFVFCPKYRLIESLYSKAYSLNVTFGTIAHLTKEAGSREQGGEPHK
jgi:hypothetical protein